MPSFACAETGLSGAQRAVCADPALATLDLELAHDAAEAIALSRHALAVSGEHLAWLANVRDACASASCLNRVYRARIAALAALAARSAHDGPEPLVRRPALHLRAPLRAALARMTNVRCLEPFFGVDLGDGRPSLVTTECRRGAPDARVFVFHPAGNAYRLVLATLMNAADLQDERAFGLRRLRVRARGSAAYASVTFFEYDGAAYRAVACGHEFVPAGEERLRFELDACPAAP